MILHVQSFNMEAWPCFCPEQTFIPCMIQDCLSSFRLKEIGPFLIALKTEVALGRNL